MPSVRCQVARSALHEYVAEQAGWRGGKAVEYPEDARNATSARALHRLADYVAGLPDTDSRLAAIAELDFYLMSSGDVLMPGEEAARLVSRYGFDRPRLFEDPGWEPESESELLDTFVATCQREAHAFSLESLDEAATSDEALEALEEFEEEADDV